jgi:hypothetical protein
MGTADDSIDLSCSHAVDQGAICYDAGSPSKQALEICRGCGGGGCAVIGWRDLFWHSRVVYSRWVVYSRSAR